MLALEVWFQICLPHWMWTLMKKKHFTALCTIKFNFWDISSRGRDQVNNLSVAKKSFFRGILRGLAFFGINSRYKIISIFALRSTFPKIFKLTASTDMCIWLFHQLFLLSAVKCECWLFDNAFHYSQNSPVVQSQMSIILTFVLVKFCQRKNIRMQIHCLWKKVSFFDIILNGKTLACSYSISRPYPVVDLAACGPLIF